MARTADKPGTFRVSKKTGADGKYRLSGVRADGSRFALRVGSPNEGNNLARSILGSVRDAVTGTVTEPSLPTGAQLPVDEYGVTIGFDLPRVSDETITSHAPPPGTQTTAPAVVVDSEKTKNAKTLAELIGVGYAGAVALGSRKFLEARYEDVPKPSKKHLNDLADNIKLGFADMFGDREVGPWTMVILLTLGVPIAMCMQSSRPKAKEEKPELHSVP